MKYVLNALAAVTGLGVGMAVGAVVYEASGGHWGVGETRFIVVSAIIAAILSVVARRRHGAASAP